jgi:RHS repeat-associated protein
MKHKQDVGGIMKSFAAVFVLCSVVLSILAGNLLADECSCLDMSSSGCRTWGSSGTGFSWVTDSNPSSGITLTSGPCGGSGESGTAYIYAYLNASSGQCDDDWNTPCNGDDYSWGRFAKIKISGNQEAFQHIFPEGLFFKGDHVYPADPPYYSGVSITETNTECDLKMSQGTQLLRIVLSAAVAQCNGSYSGSKFTIQIKFYEARNEALTQFSMLDSVSGSITVNNNPQTSFDPENFIPDVREGTANGWIEKTTYDLTSETTDSRWKVNYRNTWDCEYTTDGLEQTSTSAPGELIPSTKTVYRLKLPGFKRSMYGLPGYAAQAGWSYKWDTNETYIQYKGEGKEIRFYCDSPADNEETNRRYLIRRVECLSGGQQPDNQWYINYTYNSPAKIANIHNGSDPDDPNTVNSATIQYLYEWDGNAVDVSYKTRPTTIGTWQTERQWQVAFDAQDRAIKYDAGCSSGCSGSGEFENVTYLDPAQFDLTGYEYLVKEKKDPNGTVLLENTYDVIDFGQWVPAYWLYLRNMSFELPDVTDCEEQPDDFTGWYFSSLPSSPYLEICHLTGDPNNSTIPDGDQYVRPNGNTIEKAFDCYLSPQTQYYLSAQVRADVDLAHTSRAIIELFYDDGVDETLLSVIDVNDIGQIELVEGQWVKREDEAIDCPPEIEELTEGTFVLRVWGQYVDIDNIHLSGSVWVGGNSRPVVVQQKVYDEDSQSLKTAMTRSFDTDNFIVTEKQYLSETEYRLTKYTYTDRTFSRLASKVKYEDLSGDALTGNSFMTTYGGDDPNRIFITTYPNGKRADYQIYGDHGNPAESYVVNLDNDVNSLREFSTYKDVEDSEYYYFETPDWRIETHTNARGGVTEYQYLYDSQNDIYLLEKQLEPATAAGRQETTYRYDDARRVIKEIRKDTNGDNVYTTYNYNPATGYLDSVTVGTSTTTYLYNAFGQMTRQINPDGVKTGTSYGMGGEVVSEFMIEGHRDPNDADTTLTLISQTRYTYTDEGQIELIGKYKSDDSFSYQSDMANPADWIFTKYEYYSDGKKKKTIEDFGTGRANLTTEYFYNYQGEIEKILYPTGKWVKTTRDGRGLVILEQTGYGTDTVVLETAYSYDANGNLQQQSNPDGSVLIYTYDNYDRLKRTYQGSLSGPYTENFYTNAGDIIRQITCEADGTMISDSRMEYDVLGNLKSEWVCADPNTPDGLNDLVTSYVFDIAGNLRYEIRAGLTNSDPNENPDPNDIVTEYLYDVQGRRIQTIEPKGIVHSVFYTAAGLPEIMVGPNDPYDPNAFITNNFYDAYGRLEKTIDPMGHYTEYAYNSFNQLTRQVVYDCNETPLDTEDDFAVRQQRAEYDNLGNVTRQAVMANPASGAAITLGIDLVTDFVFDPNDGLLKEQKTYYGTGPSTAITTFAYDNIGRRFQTTDPAGNQEKITYYSDGEKNALIQKIEQKEVDSEDPQTYYTITTFFEYDDYGRLSARILDEDGDGTSDVTDPKTSFTYDALDRTKTETAPDNAVTFYDYDGFGNVKTKIEDYVDGTPDRNADRTTEFVYNRLNQQYQIKAYDPNDTTAHVAIQTTTYAYDRNGNVTQIIYPDEKSVQYAYNLLNKVDTETKRDGTEVYYWYDQRGNLTVESDDPDGFESTLTPHLLTEFKYNAAGDLVYAWKAIDLDEVSESTFTYNGFGARTSETAQYDNALTKTTTWTYDGSGNRITQTHGDTILSYTHDGLGRIKTIDKGDDEIVSYAYLGRNAKSIDYTQAETGQNFYCDELGRIEQCQSIDPAVQTILDFQYTYDIVGNRDSCKYNHLATPVWDVYEYDNLRRLEKVTYADADGYVALNIDDGRLSMDDLVVVAAAWVENESTDYTDFRDYITKNPVHLVRPVKEITVDTEQVKRQILSLLKTVDNPEIEKLVNSIKSVAPVAYDPDMPIYTLVEFGEDVPNNYTTETCRDDNDDIIAQIIYDNKGRMVLFAMYPDVGGTIVISMTYDNQGDMTSETFTTFDADGNIIDTVDMLAQQQESLFTESMSAMSMSLDGGTVMASSAPESPQSASEQFTYDHLGNRYQYTDKSGLVWAYDHNAANQYAGRQAAFATITLEDNYSHDDNGNLSVDENGNSYFYDYRNRLIEVQDPNSDTIAEYTFDALGRRIEKVVGDDSTYFFYDPQGRVIAEYQGATPELSREYVWGNNQTEILAMFTPYHEGNPDDFYDFLDFCATWLLSSGQQGYDDSFDYINDNTIDLKDFAHWASMWDIPSSIESDWYYLTDALGSIRGLVGGRFQREDDREFYNYDVYGNLSVQNGEESKSGNPYLFAGYRYDAETGYYNTPGRTYSPQIGRWLQFDPIDNADSMSLYEYVMSNPTNYYDPSGLVYEMLHPGGKSLPQPGDPVDPVSKKAAEGVGTIVAVPVVFKAQIDCIGGGICEFMENPKGNISAILDSIGAFSENVIERNVQIIINVKESNRPVKTFISEEVQWGKDFYGPMAIRGLEGFCNKVERGESSDFWEGCKARAEMTLFVTEIYYVGKGVITSGKNILRNSVDDVADDIIKPRPKTGESVTRNWGGQSGPNGKSWTRDPVPVQSRNSLGIEYNNSGEFVSHGKIIDNTGIKASEAKRWGRFKGGGDELLTDNPQCQIRLEAVTMPDNPLPDRLPTDPKP